MLRRYCAVLSLVLLLVLSGCVSYRKSIATDETKQEGLDVSGQYMLQTKDVPERLAVVKKIGSELEIVFPIAKEEEHYTYLKIGETEYLEQRTMGEDGVESFVLHKIERGDKQFVLRPMVPVLEKMKALSEQGLIENKILDNLNLKSADLLALYKPSEEVALTFKRSR